MNISLPTHHLHKFSIAITSTGDPILEDKAAKLAETLQIRQVQFDAQENYNLLVVYTEKGLQIQLKEDHGKKKPVTLMVDFLSESLTYRRQHGGGIKQALARAVGIKPGVRPSIVDATAGLGNDSFILASLGCQVTMIERSPLLAALLHDALDRATMTTTDSLAQDSAARLVLIQGNATAILKKNTKNQTILPDTIYLDPMYPHSRKSALNKQEMRIIRYLVGNDNDANELLVSAQLCASKRVVVKRPKGAPSLDDKPPSHVIKMKNSRYDVYMICHRR